MPTRDAMLLALAVTGGVITSAGVVLAGHVRRPGRAAADRAHAARDHGRARRPARHARRPVDPRAGVDVRARRATWWPSAIPARVTPDVERRISGAGLRRAARRRDDGPVMPRPQPRQRRRARPRDLAALLRRRARARAARRRRTSVSPSRGCERATARSTSSSARGAAVARALRPRDRRVHAGLSPDEGARRARPRDLRQRDVRAARTAASRCTCVTRRATSSSSTIPTRRRSLRTRCPSTCASPTSGPRRATPRGRRSGTTLEV